MREIKFRAWHDGEMYDVDDLRFNIAGVCYVHLIQPSGRILYHTPDLSKVRLMQYTGIKDKNGKEVYEGDIVLYAGGYRGVVVWDTITDGWRIRVNDTFNTRSNDMEVIGNIYENPELVK